MESPLHEAAYSGDIKKVKKLVKQGKIDINKVGKKVGKLLFTGLLTK